MVAAMTDPLCGAGIDASGVDVAAVRRVTWRTGTGSGNERSAPAHRGQCAAVSFAGSGCACSARAGSLETSALPVLSDRGAGVKGPAPYSGPASAAALRPSELLLQLADPRLGHSALFLPRRRFRFRAAIRFRAPSSFGLLRRLEQLPLSIDEAEAEVLPLTLRRRGGASPALTTTAPSSRPRSRSARRSTGPPARRRRSGPSRTSRTRSDRGRSPCSFR